MRPDANRLFDSAVAYDLRWDLPLPPRTELEDDLLRVRDEAVKAIEGDMASDDATHGHRLAVAHEDMHDEAFVYTRQTIAFAPRVLSTRWPQPAPSRATRASAEAPSRSGAAATTPSCSTTSAGYTNATWRPFAWPGPRRLHGLRRRGWLRGDALEQGGLVVTKEGEGEQAPLLAPPLRVGAPSIRWLPLEPHRAMPRVASPRTTSGATHGVKLAPEPRTCPTRSRLIHIYCDLPRHSEVSPSRLHQSATQCAPRLATNEA